MATAVAEPMAAVAVQSVPDQLLDDGELVLLAIKPSPWFVVFDSLKWILAAAFIMATVMAGLVDSIDVALQSYLVQASLAAALLRIALAALRWVSRHYVLTNRRIVRIRGVFRVQIFECPLVRVQRARLTFSWRERLARLGTIGFARDAAGSPEAHWRQVARPHEVYEKVRKAIDTAHHHDFRIDL